MHQLALSGGPAHEKGHDDAEGREGEDEDFGVHLLKSGKLNEESGNKINHEIRQILRRVFSFHLGENINSRSQLQLGYRFVLAGQYLIDTNRARLIKCWSIDRGRQFERFG